MIAVVIGGTGLVGLTLLQKLVQDAEITSIISVSRKPCGLKSDKLHEILIQDLAELSTYKERLQGDYYFCCLGTTIKVAGSQEQFRKVDQKAVIDFAQIAQFHQAQALAVVTAAGANEKSLIFYSRVKGEVESALKKMEFRRLIIFKPALLMGTRKVARAGEGMASSVFKILSPVLPKSVEKKLMTSAETLAERMLSEVKKSSLENIQLIEAQQI